MKHPFPKSPDIHAENSLNLYGKPRLFFLGVMLIFFIVLFIDNSIIKTQVLNIFFTTSEDKDTLEAFFIYSTFLCIIWAVGYSIISYLKVGVTSSWLSPLKHDVNDFFLLTLDIIKRGAQACLTIFLFLTIIYLSWKACYAGAISFPKKLGLDHLPGVILIQAYIMIEMHYFVSCFIHLLIMCFVRPNK